MMPVYKDVTCSTRLPTILLIAVVSLAACQADDSTSDNDSVTAVKVASVPEIAVYKTPTCGCCAEWVTYLKDEGFNVTAIDHDDLDPIRAELGLSDPKLQSCHTAIVDGYIVEGHVPANDIKRYQTIVARKTTTYKRHYRPRYANDVAWYG